MIFWLLFIIVYECRLLHMSYGWTFGGPLWWRERHQNSLPHLEEVLASEKREEVLIYIKNGHQVFVIYFLNCSLHRSCCSEDILGFKGIFPLNTLQFSICINFSTLSRNQDLGSATTTRGNCFHQPTAWLIRATCVLRLVIGSDYSCFLYHSFYFTEDMLVFFSFFLFACWFWVFLEKVWLRKPFCEKAWWCQTIFSVRFLSFSSVIIMLWSVKLPKTS